MVDNLTPSERSGASSKSQYLFWFLPIGVGLVILMTTLVLWHFQVRREQTHVQREIQLAADVFGGNVESAIAVQVKALNRMAERWNSLGGTPKDVWERDAQNMFSDLQSFQAIEWADAKPQIRWIVPLAGNEQALGLNLFFEEKRRQALERAIADKTPVMTGVVDLIQGGKGFILYIPVFAQGEFDGFMVGVFRVQDFYDYVLAHTSIKDYNVQVFEGDALVYESVHGGELIWPEETLIQTMDIQWRIRVWPTQAVLDDMHSWLPEFSLGVGVGMSFLFGILVWFFNVSRRREFDLREARDMLSAALYSRDQTDHELQETLTALEVSNEESRKSEERFRKLAQRVPAGIFQIDMQGNCVFINDNWREMTGRSLEDASGRQWLMALHPEDRRRVVVAWRRARRNNEDIVMEFRFLKPDGQILWAEGRATALLDASG